MHHSEVASRAKRPELNAYSSVSIPFYPAATSNVWLPTRHSVSTVGVPLSCRSRCCARSVCTGSGYSISIKRQPSRTRAPLARSSITRPHWICQMAAQGRCCRFSFCCFWLFSGIGASYPAPAFSLALVREHPPSPSSPRTVRARGASALQPMIIAMQRARARTRSLQAFFIPD